eukprot:COSAG06_NODE_35383_length_460_cov_8.448753_1_plen_22_part_01
MSSIDLRLTYIIWPTHMDIHQC